jgi:DNA-binding NarL/FixJ family response regulator
MIPIRVFLADDHPMMLNGIRALLDREHGLSVVGEALDGRAALAGATELRPDIVVLDISMPGLNGVELAERLASSLPECRIVALSVHEDRAYVRRLLEVGAVGYVLKRSAATELVRALRAVATGGIYLDPAVAAGAIGWQSARRTVITGAPLAELSDREVAVMRLTAEGHGNKAIARLLGIAIKTVETHKANGMTKLGFESRVELVRYAASRGWIGMA